MSRSRRPHSPHAKASCRCCHQIASALLLLVLAFCGLQRLCRLGTTLVLAALLFFALELFLQCQRRCVGRQVEETGVPSRGRLLALPRVAADILFASPVDITVRPSKAGLQQLQLNPIVSCIQVPDLTELTEEQKGHLWWQPADFAEFLRLRVEIGRKYREVAKKLGLGSGDAFPKIPELADSRRGLGLGRKGQRAKNKDAYVTAVLEEQSRQQELAIFQMRDHGVCHDGVSPVFVRDVDALAEVARNISVKDQIYAHEMAQKYHDEDALDRSSGNEATQPLLLMSPPIPQDFLPLEEEFLALAEGVDVKDLPDVGQNKQPRSSKGYGISRENLQEVGLSITGHSISRFQRLRLLGTTKSDHEESEAMSCESEDDSPSSALSALADYGSPGTYRRWRMGAQIRTGLPGQSETSTYGNRKEYRSWRAWAKPG